MSNRHLFLIAVFVSIGVAGVYTGLAGAYTGVQETSGAKQAQAAATTSPATQQGYRVYIDPATGKRTTPPPGVAVPAAPRAVGTAPQPKVINLGPGKGVAMDMRGHYQEMRTTVDKQGHVSTRCGPARHAPADHSARGGVQ